MWVRAAVVVALVRLRPLVSIRSIAFGVCEREEAEPALWSCRVPLGVPSGQLGCWFLPLSFFFFFFRHFEAAEALLCDATSRSVDEAHAALLAADCRMEETKTRPRWTKNN